MEWREVRKILKSGSYQQSSFRLRKFSAREIWKYVISLNSKTCIHLLEFLLLYFTKRDELKSDERFPVCTAKGNENPLSLVMLHGDRDPDGSIKSPCLTQSLRKDSTGGIFGNME